QSRVYRVTQLRTDGVHCRESAGTGPVNLKLVPNGFCLGRSPWTIICASLSHFRHEVCMLKVPKSRRPVLPAVYLYTIFSLSLRNLVSGYECGRVFPAGVGPGSPSRDAVNWLLSRFGLS
ncbi:unnamed protein product, partial [Ascophyllum nodosum]